MMKLRTGMTIVLILGMAMGLIGQYRHYEGRLRSLEKQRGREVLDLLTCYSNTVVQRNQLQARLDALTSIGGPSSVAASNDE